MLCNSSKATDGLELLDRGISLQYLIDFMKTEKIDGVSVADKLGNDIKNAITVPRTKASGLSFSEFLKKKGQKDSHGNDAIGKCQFFISHAWSYKFSVLISALSRWKKLNGFPEKEPIYLFVDYFTVNQNKPTEDLKGLSDMIVKSDKTILVLTPWHQPVPLTRSWCVYEIYKTAVKEEEAEKAAKAEAKKAGQDDTSIEVTCLQITMPDNDVKGFEDMMMKDYEGFVSKLSRQNVRDAIATVPTDQKMIEDEIKSTVGYTKVQKMVFRSIIKWMSREASKKLEEMRKEFAAGESANSPLDYTKKKELMKFAYYLGRLYRKDVGNFKMAIEAQKIVEQVGETMDKDRKPDVEDNGKKWDAVSQTIDAMTERSYCLNDQDENSGNFRSMTIDLKVSIADRCLKRYKLENKNTCKALHAVARSLGDTDPWFAAKINRLVYETRKKVLKPGDKDILNSLNELADNYVDTGRLEEALKLQLEVLKGRIKDKKMGPRHPRTARAKRKVGITLHKLGDKARGDDPALGYLMEAYKDSLELCGDTHKDTLETMEALLECLMGQEDETKQVDPKRTVKDLVDEVFKKLKASYTKRDANSPTKKQSVLRKELNYEARKRIMELGLPFDTVMMGAPVLTVGADEASQEKPVSAAKSLLLSLGKGGMKDESKQEEDAGLTRNWTAPKGNVKGQKIKTAHWNILADKLSGLYDKPGSKKIFHKCPKDALVWEKRCKAIVAEILRQDPDVFTLCELDKFDDIIKALNGKYEGQLLLRKGKKDGSGIFWRSGMLEKGRELSTFVDVDGKQWEQVVLGIELATKDGKTRFIQACSHLKSDKKPEGEVLRQKQAADILAKLAAHFGTDTPLILNMDLNSSNVPLYKGSRPLKAGEEVGKDSYEPLVYPDILRNEAFGLKSAYKEVQGSEPWATSAKWRPEGPPENPDKKYEYCIDFIFVSKQITPVSVLEVFRPDQIPADAFPSADYPSDHELIAAELIL